MAQEDGVVEMGQAPAMPGKPRVDVLAETRFVRLYDLVYDEGRQHYFEASRRTPDALLATKDEEELRQALPDAVSACLVVLTPGEEPRMVLSYEFRYPTGQWVLGIPSGLIDERDYGEENPCVSAMVREIAEETGVRLGEGDTIEVVNPFLFNSPGLTDESTALLCAVAHLDDLSSLSQAGAEGSERFDGFELLTKADAQEVLARGRDPHGHFYPLVAWAALTYFACDLWR
jgi:ADP-ribose pyrophosphatase